MIPDEKKKDKRTHLESVADHLKANGSITTWEAIELYGCTRLSARISDLRKLGWNITSTTETGKNRNGHISNYSRYSIGGANDIPA